MAAASRRASPAPRRVLALKRADGEPLTRADIQYDFLDAVFSDPKEVFSDPHSPSNAEHSTKICFRDLYVQAILQSPKATKALKDKMGEATTFAVDFAMLSLLVNVGRVNTTMSFFPEMKTAIRTYHPIPSLQRTNGNMQDAPRIKHILKTSVLDDEAKSCPATPADILARCKSGHQPSTSVTNLIFVLAHHSGSIGQAHFQGRVDFLDLILRTDISSSSRAQAFLWLCYNYLESPSSSEDDYDEDDADAAGLNPFSGSKETGPPPFSYLTEEEMLEENRESAEDNALTDKLVTQRNRILQTHGAKDVKGSNKASVSGSVAGDDDDAAVSVAADEIKPKGKQRAAPASTSGKAKGKRATPAPPKEKKNPLPKEKEKAKEREPLSLVPDLDDDDRMFNAYLQQRSMPKKHRPAEQSVGHFTSLPGTQPVHRNGNGSDHLHRHRYSPYAYPYAYPSQSALPVKDSPWRYRHSHLSQPRSMLQQAWHVVTSTDPLVDSDDEAGGDEYAREDYIQRLKVINRFSRSHWPQEPAYGTEMDTDPL